MMSRGFHNPDRFLMGDSLSSPIDIPRKRYLRDLAAACRERLAALRSLTPQPIQEILREESLLKGAEKELERLDDQLLGFSL